MMSDMQTDSKDHKLCRGCLSSGRRLTSVNTDHFYYSLLTGEQKREAETAAISLCWECIAMLRRIKKFQAQVQRSHTILENCLGLYPVKPLLSSLGTHHKCDFDVIFEERNSNEQVDTIVTPTKYKMLLQDIEMKLEIDKNIEDIKCEEMTTHIKTEYTEYSSDDDNDNVDDHDNLDSSNATLNLPEITIKTRQSVQNSEKNTEQPIKHTPTLKTPTVEKLEQEIDNFKKSKIKNKGTTSKKKHVISIEGDENSDVDGVPKNEENEPKQKLKRVRSKSIPDSSFKKDNSNSKFVTKRYLNNGRIGEIRVKWNKRHNFRKVISRYKGFENVLSFFTKVKVSASEFKSILEKEDAIADSVTPHKCSICGMHFKLTKCMRNHARLFHKGSLPEYFIDGIFSNLPLPVPPDPCLWRCNVCGRVLREEHAVAHVNTYHRIRFYCGEDGCEWSPKFYWTMEDHKEHLNAFHTQYLCDICGKSQKRRKAMEEHMRQVHMKKPSVPCSQCELVFMTRRKLRHHMITHRVEPPELRYCVECDTTYSSISQRNYHFNTRHRGSRPSFPCGDCGRVFRKKFHMKCHYDLVHKGKTNYQCNICGKYLSKKNGLKKHIDVHNKIKLPHTKPCNVCGRKFQTNKTLQNHMFTHTGERPYRCPHCDAAYTQPYCLKVHLKNRHGVDRTVGVKDAVFNT